MLHHCPRETQYDIILLRIVNNEMCILHRITLVSHLWQTVGKTDSVALEFQTPNFLGLLREICTSLAWSCVRGWGEMVPLLILGHK